MNGTSMIKPPFPAILVVGFGAFAFTVDAAHGGEPVPGFSGDVAVYGGALGVSDGFEDRVYGGLFGNANTEGGVGFHLDISHQWREHDAVFGAIGLSAELAPGIRPKLQIGGSTVNEGILPKFLVDGSVRIESGAAPDMILELCGTYRDFRNGVDEGSLRGEVIKYFRALPAQSGS